MKKFFLILFITTLGSAFAGESFFGISDKSIGMLSIPYSAPGLGRSYEIASTDSSQINYMNYSMWSDISLTSYSVKISFNGARTEDLSKNTFSNSVANYAGGFLTVPILKKRLAFGFGLIPVSDMEQRYEEILDSDGNSYEMLVRGGLSKAVINLSFNVLPNFGVGLAYEYNFGKISKDFRYLDSVSELSPLLLQYEYQFFGHGMALSAHYSPLEKLSLGLIYRPKVDVDFDVQAQTNASSVDQQTQKTITLPAQIGLGVEYMLASRWAAGADYHFQNWKAEYQLQGQALGTPFSQYQYIGVGLERKHSTKLFTSITEKMDYRLGGFYRQLSQLSNGSPVNEYGISFGFSLPLQRFQSKIDFSGLIGKRGSLSDNAYQENFYRVGISVSAMETWFVKLKD